MFQNKSLDLASSSASRSKKAGVTGGEMMSSDPDAEVIVAVGPMIAGWHEERPVYWFDVVYADGHTVRHVEKKDLPLDAPGHEIHRVRDEIARKQMLSRRARFIYEHRPDIITLHDKDSLRMLLDLLKKARTR